MDSSPITDVSVPRYSENTLSCFSHVKCSQNYLYDCSEDYLLSNVKLNEKKRSDQLGLSQELKDESNRVLIIVGPSGVGKSTLIQLLMEKHPNQF